MCNYLYSICIYTIYVVCSASKIQDTDIINTYEKINNKEREKEKRTKKTTKQTQTKPPSSNIYNSCKMDSSGHATLLHMNYMCNSTSQN